MLSIIKKLDAASIRALIAATIPLLGLIATLFGVDQAVFDAAADKWVQIGLALLTAGGIAWAAWARLFMPTPPLTETAAIKTEMMIRSGEIRTTPVPKTGGFVRVVLLAVLLIGGAIAVAPISGCAGTRAAYATASKSEQALADTAYVVAEHYAALVHEAALLAQHTSTPTEAIEAMQAADRVVKPFIIGSDTQPGLRQARDRYVAVKDATTAEELQRALDDASRELVKLINAVKSARGTP